PGSCSSMRSSRFRHRTRPSRVGGAPMPSFVPPPQGVTGMPWSAASVRICAISSFEPGNTTASGVRPSRTYGEQSTPVSTCGAPQRLTSLSVNTLPTVADCLQVGGSEPLRQTLLLDRMRTIRGPDLDARLVRREDLPGVATAGRVERLLHALHAREVGIREDERHVVHLLEPDPVLARDRPAHVRADLEDLAAGVDHARLLAGLSRIVEDVWMQVAVAGMEHIDG